MGKTVCTLHQQTHYTLLKKSLQNICFICFHLQHTDSQVINREADGSRWKQMFLDEYLKVHGYE
jgi:hypothetical protein